MPVKLAAPLATQAAIGTTAAAKLGTLATMMSGSVAPAVTGAGLGSSMAGVMGPIASSLGNSMGGLGIEASMLSQGAGIAQGMYNVSGASQIALNNSLQGFGAGAGKTKALKMGFKGLEALQMLGQATQDAALQDYQARSQEISARQAGLQARSEMIAIDRQYLNESGEMRAQYAARGVGGSFGQALSTAREDYRYGRGNVALGGELRAAGYQSNANLYSQAARNTRSQGYQDAAGNMVGTMFERLKARGEIA